MQTKAELRETIGCSICFKEKYVPGKCLPYGGNAVNHKRKKMSIGFGKGIDRNEKIFFVPGKHQKKNFKKFFLIPEKKANESPV